MSTSPIPNLQEDISFREVWLKILFDLSALALLTTIASAPSFFIYPGNDLGGFWAVSNQISINMLPYRDFFLVKTPLFFFFLSGWKVFLGAGWYSIKMNTIIIYVLWTWSIYCFAYASRNNRTVAIIAGLIGSLFVVRLGFDIVHHGSHITFSTTFEMLSLAALCMAMREPEKDSRKDIAFAVLAGLMASMAFYARQTSISAFAIFTIVWFLLCIFRRSIQYRIGFGFVIGGLIAVGPALLFILLARIPLDNLYSNLIVHNSKYLNVWDRSTQFENWKNTLIDYGFMPMILFAALQIVILCVSRTQRIQWNTWYISIFGLAIGIFFAVIPVRVALYYSHQFLPFLILLCANFIYSGYLAARKNQLALIAFAFLFGSMIPHLYTNILRPEIDLQRLIFRTAKHYSFNPENYPDQQIARLIEKDNDDARLWVFGYRPWIYVFADKTNYYQHFDIGVFKEQFLPREDFEQWMVDFRKEPPRYVVQTSQVARSEPYWDAVKKMILSNYEVAAEVDVSKAVPYASKIPTRVYRLRTDAVLPLKDNLNRENNLIENGGFEFTYPPTPFTWSLDKAFEGEQSAMLKVSPTIKRQSGNLVRFSTLIPGDMYEAKMKIMIPDLIGGVVRLRISLLNEAREKLGVIVWEDFSKPIQSWESTTKWFDSSTIPEGTTGYSVYVDYSGDKNIMAGTAYFDNLELNVYP